MRINVGNRNPRLSYGGDLGFTLTLDLVTGKPAGEGSAHQRA